MAKYTASYLSNICDELKQQILKFNKIKDEISLKDNVCDNLREKMIFIDIKLEGLSENTKDTECFCLKSLGATLVDIGDLFGVSPVTIDLRVRRHRRRINYRIVKISEFISLYNRRNECRNCLAKI